jgi:hypothetical protein
MRHREKQKPRPAPWVRLVKDLKRHLTEVANLRFDRYPLERGLGVRKMGRHLDFLSIGLLFVTKRIEGVIGHRGLLPNLLVSKGEIDPLVNPLTHEIGLKRSPHLARKLLRVLQY